jgi:hypothetical protein
MPIHPVIHPATATDNSVPRQNGTTGKLLQSSGVTIDDSNNVTIPGKFTGGTTSTNSASYGFLGGGQNCSIASGADHGVVVGGNNCDITGTGDDCAIGGGNGNQITTNAIGATIPGGVGNVALSNYSQATGYQSTTRSLQGAISNSNGQVTGVGDRQNRTVQLRGQSTTATFVSLTADGGTDSTTDTFQIPEDSAAILIFGVIGVKSGGTEVAFYIVEALVKRFVSTTTLVWSNVTVNYEDDSAWDVQVATYSLGIKIEAKGNTSETVNWTAFLRSVEIVE